MNLLGLKAVQSARLSFEAYENEAITPVYWEAKQTILEAVSAEDSRPISAWNDVSYHLPAGLRYRFASASCRAPQGPTSSRLAPRTLNVEEGAALFAPSRCST